MSAPTPPNSLLNTDAAHAFAARRLVEIAGDSILHFPESVSSKKKRRLVGSPRSSRSTPRHLPKN